MYRFIVVAALCALPVIARAQGPDVGKILSELKKQDTGRRAVSEGEGRLLRVRVASKGAKRALEIGGASGYSAIWIAMGLRETGGRLVTIEYDPARARELAANIKRAGLSSVVEVV